MLNSTQVAKYILVSNNGERYADIEHDTLKDAVKLAKDISVLYTTGVMLFEDGKELLSIDKGEVITSGYTNL